MWRWEIFRVHRRLKKLPTSTMNSWISMEARRCFWTASLSQRCISLNMKKQKPSWRTRSLRWDIILLHIKRWSMCQASGDGETFANLVVVSTHLNRPQEVITRYIRWGSLSSWLPMSWSYGLWYSQLQAKVPNHALLQLYATFQSAYDRVSASYKL